MVDTMKRILSLLCLILAPASAFAQPACTVAAPNAVACQGSAANLGSADVLLGQQLAGPSRANQTVKVTPPQITAGGFPGLFSTVEGRGPDASTVFTLGNSAGTARLSVNVLASGGYQIFDHGNGTANLDISALNGSVTIPFVNGANLSNQNLNTAGPWFHNLRAFSAWSGTLTGTRAAGANYLGLIQSTSDDCSCGAGIFGMWINESAGGTNTVGNRIALRSNLTFTGGPSNRGLGLGNQYAGLQSYATASGSVGGTSGVGHSWGTMWGGVISGELTNGADYWSQVKGLEVDVGASGTAGTTVNQLIGLDVILAGTTRVSTYQDALLAFASFPTGSGAIYNGILFGEPGGYWPFNTSSYMMTTTDTNKDQTGPFPPLVAAMGIDFSNVRFTTAFLKGPSGSGIDGAGALITGSAKLSVSSATTTLDTPGNVITAVAVHTAGTGYSASEELHDGYGGTYSITVGGGGAITAISQVGASGAVIGAAPCTVDCALSGGKGSNATADLTWTAGTTISLGPTAATTINIGNAGSTTTITGAIHAGASAGVTCAGSPTAGFATVNGLVTAC